MQTNYFCLYIRLVSDDISNGVLGLARSSFFEILASTLVQYSKSKCSRSIIWVHTAPGAYLLNASGTVCISNMILEHIWLRIFFQILDHMVQDQLVLDHMQLVLNHKLRPKSHKSLGQYQLAKLTQIWLLFMHVYKKPNQNKKWTLQPDLETHFIIRKSLSDNLFYKIHLRSITQTLY